MEIANPELVSRLEDSFPQFDTQLRERIASIGTLMEFRPEQEVMRTGQYFKTTMLVLEGKLKLYREDEEGNEFFLYYLEPGMACALSMICATRNQVSEVKAVAVEETLAIGLPIQHMDELMTEHRNWYYFVLETYRSRFEELLNVIDQVTFRSMDEKLIFYLKRQFDAFGSDTLHTTHQTIAYDLNSSREVISRLLKKLEQQGYVVLHRNSIEKRKVDNSQFAW
jgi:CRP/FNR family transcriptional regulator, anaerobic regulatory protein